MVILHGCRSVFKSRMKISRRGMCHEEQFKGSAMHEKKELLTDKRFSDYLKH
jgi:hypothetical protein